MRQLPITRVTLTETSCCIDTPTVREPVPSLLSKSSLGEIPTYYFYRNPRIYWAMSIALLGFACLLFAPASIAGSSTFTGQFSLGDGVSTVDGSAGNTVVEEQITIGPTWDTSGGFGGTVTGAFGDTYGLQVNTVSSGKVQLDLGYHSTSGLFTAQTPISLRLNLPDQIRPGETFTVSSILDFSLPSLSPSIPQQKLSFQTTSSDFGFRAGIALETNTVISGQACLVNCDNFNLALASFVQQQELLSFNYDATAASPIDSFDQEIILLRGNALETPITDLVRNAAVNTPIQLIPGPSGKLLSLTYGNAGQTTLFPVAQAEGTYTDGAATVSGSARADIFRLNANLGQIATLASGGAFPALEGDLKTLLTNTPDRAAIYNGLPGVVKNTLDQVKYNLLRAEAGVALGFEQNFELGVPDVMVDLMIEQTGQTFSFLAGTEGNITLPESLTESINITDLTFNVSARFLPTLVEAQTDLTLTPIFTLTGPRLELGLLKTPLIAQTWDLPGVAVNIADNQFLVQFEGGLAGTNLSLGSIIDRSRSIMNLTATNGFLDIAGAYTNTIIRPDQSVSQVRTVGNVDLINSLVGSGAAPVLTINHNLKMRAGSQLGTTEIRIGNTGSLSVTQGQIARNDEIAPGGNSMMDVYLGGTISIDAITDGFDVFGNPVVTGGGSLLIESANVRPDFDGVGQGLIDVRGPAGLGTGANKLRLSNIGVFEAALDVGAHGVVDIDAVLGSPTHFNGERVFDLAGTAGGSVRNFNVINIRSAGAISFDTGLLQTGASPSDFGFLSVGSTIGPVPVASTLELRSNLSGGFVRLYNGSTLKLYDGGALDARVRVEGESQAQVVVMGDSLIDGLVTLNGTGSSRPLFTTDHASFNETGQPGVSATPHLQLESALIDIRQGTLFNAVGAHIAANGQVDIVLAVGPNSVQTGFGNVYGKVGTVENHGLFEFVDGNSTLTRYQTNATNVLPALMNFEGASLAVNAGQTKISGGLFNYGDVSIGTASGQNAELRLGNTAGGTNQAANHDFTQQSGSTTILETGSFVMGADANLIINGGTVDFFGQRFEGSVINNGGTLTIDTANSQNPLQAELIGNFTQMAGELVIGSNQLLGGFHITGTATFGGILDLTAFQSGIDGLVGGFDFTIQQGEQFEALSFGASLSRFGAYRLPDVNSFYWLPVYSDTALAFRLQDPLLSAFNITSIVQEFQSQIGVVPDMPETVDAMNAELELAAQLQIGNSFSGDGILNITDAVLNTTVAGISIEQTGQLNAMNNSVVAASGDINVNGGSLQLLGNSRITAAADGIAIVAMNGADVRHEGDGYEIPADGSIRVESGAEMFINGSLDFANDRGGLIRVMGPGSTLTAAPNGELSEWFVPVSPLGTHGEVEVSNGGIFNLGSVIATAISDEFTIDITGANSVFQQTADASLDLGRSTDRRGDVFGGVTLTVANGGQVITGNGGIYLGYLGVLNLNGGTFNANSDIDVVGGQINGSGLALELNGHDLAAYDKAVLNFNTTLALSGGSVVELVADARLNALAIDINSAQATGGGALIAAGGLTFIDTDPGLVSHWGNSANTAQIRLLDGITANFGSVEMEGPGTSLIIGSDLLGPTGNRQLSQVSMQGLAAGTTGGLNSNVFIQLNDGASVFVNGTLGLGSADQSAASLEMNGGILTVDHVDVNATGQIVINTGVLKPQSSLTIDGGLMQNGGGVGEIGAAANLVIGSEIGSAGDYALNGNGQLSVNNAFIGDRGAGTFTQTDGSNTLNAYLVLGANPGSDGHYNFVDGNLSADHEFIGDKSIGTFTHTGGSNTVTSNLVVGANDGSTGAYILSDLGFVNAGNEYIGDSGVGTFDHSGGTNTLSGILVVGANSTGDGSYTLSGNLGVELSAVDEYIGDNGTGAFIQSGGKNAVSGNLFLGANAGSSGTYTMNGLGILSAGSEYVGVNGTGAFIQSDGGNNVNTLFVGGINGTYDLSGVNGGLFANDEVIGYQGLGTFRQSGGVNEVVATLYLGGVNGSYILSGGDLSVGNIARIAGTSTFNLDGGALTVNGASIDVDTFNVGSVAGAIGGFILGSGKTLTATSLNVSNSGSSLAGGAVQDLDGGAITTDTLAIANGGSLTSRGAWIGSNVASPNSVNVLTSADVGGVGSLWQSRFLNIGYNGDGSVHVADGGTVATTNNLILGGTDARSGALTIGEGGTVDTGMNAYVGRANAAIGSVVLEGAGATWNIGDSLYLGGDNLIAGGDGSLTIGDGAVVNVTNTIKFWQGGSLFVQGGELNASTIDVGGSGLTLTGGILAVDTFNGDLINQGATLAPGNSPGITEVFGNYSQDANSTLQIEIGNVSAGIGGYDALHVSGLAELGGTLVVDLYNFGGGAFVPQLGDAFNIVEAETITGDFDVFMLALLGGGLGWELNYFVDAFGSTDVLELSVASAVPLPPAVWMFIGALVGLFGIARRQVENRQVPI